MKERVFMNMKKIYKKKFKKLPGFKSLHEEAVFWDTHSLTDYYDFSKMKRVRFVLEDSKKDKSLTIRLPSEVIDKVKATANNIGLSVSSLARMWFIEKIAAKSSK